MAVWRPAARARVARVRGAHAGAGGRCRDPGVSRRHDGRGAALLFRCRRRLRGRHAGARRGAQPARTGRARAAGRHRAAPLQYAGNR